MRVILQGFVDPIMQQEVGTKGSAMLIQVKSLQVMRLHFFIKGQTAVFRKQKLDKMNFEKEAPANT